MKADYKNEIVEDENGCFLIIYMNAQSDKVYETKQEAKKDSDLDEKAYEQCDCMSDYEDMTPITWL